MSRFSRPRTHSFRLLVSSLVCGLSIGICAAQQVGPADENLVVPVVYPPLTEREGKDLSLPRPPAEHPRLFLRAADLPAMRRKATHPLLRKAWERINAAAQRPTSGELRPGVVHNLDLAVRDALEARALRYLISGDEPAGREAIAGLLRFYATLRIDPGRPDVCREIGRVILTGAMVYDWCYPLLTAPEKQRLVDRMETLATQLEIEWPRLVQGSVVGHGAEAQLARDVLACGVATFDEKPDLYHRAAGRLFAEFLPVRRFFYPAGYHHQGSAYGPYRLQWDLYTTLIFDRMGYPAVYGREQARAPYYFLYSRRPDGQLFRNGDDFLEVQMPFGRYWNAGSTANALAGSYFRDPVVLNEALKEKPAGEGDDFLLEFLWFDPWVVDPTATTATLPLTRYFPAPFGAMIARTGWETGPTSPAVVAEMKVGVYNFANHQHLDAGSFQLYYKGPLAVQSGVYQGRQGGYGGAHFKNYSQRSIAHNTLLVHDPAETFRWHNHDVLNDGGQRFPNAAREPQTLADLLTKDYQTGRVLAHAVGPDSARPDFSYLKGDITAAYSAKVKHCTRSFVFLNLGSGPVPAALVVCDRVTATDPGFQKTWLLHSVEEPTVRGEETTVVRLGKGYGGKLINTTLLPEPENLRIAKVGGPERAYWVAGQNFTQSPQLPNSSADSAVWRIEVSPRQPAATDRFLNVLEVMNQATARPAADAPRRVETEKLVGAVVGDRLVLFGKEAEPLAERFTLDVPGTGAVRVLIADLAEGTWTIESAGKKSENHPVTAETNAVYFTAQPGRYVFTRR